MLQTFRRLVQVTALLLIIAIPVLSNYGVIIQSKSQRDFVEVTKESSSAEFAPVYSALHNVFKPEFKPDATMEKLDTHKGALWSLTLFGFNMTDPLGALIAVAGSWGIYTPLLISILIPVALMLFFGRFVCGWLCPMGLILEMTDKLGALIRRLNLPVLDLKMSGVYKYYVLAGGLMLTMMGLSLLPYLLPYALVSREVYYYVFYQSVGVGAVLMLLMIMFELLISRRGWCAYLCPGGAFFSLVGARRLLRIKRQAQGCQSDCFVCNEMCEMGLKPKEDQFGMECNNCGVCVSACPPDVLKYKLSLKD